MHICKFEDVIEIRQQPINERIYILSTVDSPFYTIKSLVLNRMAVSFNGITLEIYGTHALTNYKSMTLLLQLKDATKIAFRFQKFLPKYLDCLNVF